jgi:hypothetical protein
LEQFNIYTEFVGLIARRTTAWTAITADSINTFFIWSAGIVRAFIYIHTSIVCLIKYCSYSAIIYHTNTIIRSNCINTFEWMMACMWSYSTLINVSALTCQGIFGITNLLIILLQIDIIEKQILKLWYGTKNFQTSWQ